MKTVEKEKQKIKNAAKKALLKTEVLLEQKDVRAVIDELKTQYNLCEMTCRIICEKYTIAQGKKKSETNFTMVSIPPALINFAGYDFQRELLTDIFGASSPKGKTIRTLRNKVTHGIDEKAVKEILERKEELFGYMDTFLATIRSGE